MKGMMAVRRVLFSLLLGILLISGGASARTWSGTTGLLNTPTADVIPENRVGLGLSWVGNSGVTYAVFSPMNGVEMGIGSQAFGQGRWAGGALYGFLKWRIISEEGGRPAIAIGMERNTYYAVLSQSLGWRGLRGHLGLGTGGRDGFFGGLSWTLNPVTISTDNSLWRVPITSLLLEVEGTKPSLGARLRLTPEFEVVLGMHHLKDFGVNAFYQVRF